MQKYCTYIEELQAHKPTIHQLIEKTCRTAARAQYIFVNRRV